MKIKLCGFKEEESLKCAIAQNCDFIGFIFFDKSPRYISPENAGKLAKLIPSSIAKVAVVVNPDFEYLEKIIAEFSPNYFQFHGEESLNFIKEVKEKFPQIGIIKALKISTKEDLEKTKIFQDDVNFLLLDNKVAGSGESFDWKILENFHNKKDWFLSGGINIDNVEKAIEISHAKILDISSGIEKVRGEKSPKLIKELMEKIKNHAD